MKKYLNSILCFTLIILFAGCSDDKDTKNTDKETTANSETTTTVNLETTTEDDVHSDKYYFNSYGGGANAYRKVDGEYGLRGVPIEYETGEVEIGISRYSSYEKDGNLLDIDIYLYTMVVCNDEFIEFGIEGSEKSIVQKMVVENNENVTYDINFTPYGLIEDGEVKAKVLIFSQPSKYSVDDNGRAGWMENPSPDGFEFTIVSTNGGKAPENTLSICNENYNVNKFSIVDDHYTENEDREYLFSHNIPSFGGNPEEDFIVEKEDGTYQFMAIRNLEQWIKDDDGDIDAENISESYITVLFCDGKLYPAFDRSYIFSWETVGMNTVVKELDLSGLEKGEHELFTYTYYINNKAGIRSQMTNIVIE